jgi:hypothetical protein
VSECGSVERIDCVKEIGHECGDRHACASAPEVKPPFPPLLHSGGCTTRISIPGSMRS